MVKVISIANRKGGVGKTTTTVNIATAMAAIGKRVLILDMDPQGNATTSLGINKNKCLYSTYDLMINNCKIEDAIVKTEIKIERDYRLISSRRRGIYKEFTTI